MFSSVEWTLQRYLVILIQEKPYGIILIATINSKYSHIIPACPKWVRVVQSVGALKRGINKIILGVPKWVRKQNLVSQIVTAGLRPGALKRSVRPGVSKRHLRVVDVHLSTSLVFTPSYYPQNWKLPKKFKHWVTSQVLPSIRKYGQ